MFEISVKRVHAPGGEIKRLRLTRTAYIIEGDVELRFHNRFICVGVDISVYALLTEGRSYYLPV